VFLEGVVPPFERLTPDAPPVEEEVLVSVVLAEPAVEEVEPAAAVAPPPFAPELLPEAASMRGRSASRGVGAAAKEAANADSVREAANAATTPMTIIHRRMTQLPFDRRRRRAGGFPPVGPTIVLRFGEASLRAA
jgi:hypothetical protein